MNNRPDASPKMGRVTNAFAYLKAKAYLEENSIDKRTLIMSRDTVVIDEESLMHIISRHYGELTKPYKSNKSFHDLDFDMDYLNIQLGGVFSQIDNAKVLPDKQLDKLLFVYKDKKYITVFKRLERHKLRLKTFYPIEIPKRLEDIQNKYILHMITKEVGVYLEKN